jgi:RNA polymerase sigma factor (sigma-70 family)
VERQDAELIADFLQTRGEESFRALYQRHTNALYLFSLRLSGGFPHVAEDVVQETWIRAIRKLPDFNPEFKLKNWLLGIATHCYQEFSRKNRSFQIDHSSPVFQDNHSGDLEHLIRSLPDGCRQVLVLHDIYGYTHGEISSILGIHAGTSKSQLFDARSKLRARLTRRKK